MNDPEHYKQIARTSKRIEEAVARAQKELERRIRDGQAPRDAVEAVMEQFSEEYGALLAAHFAAVTTARVGMTSSATISVGSVTLSQRLYAQTQKTATTVAGIVDRHARGFQDARKLALELYEGYDFNETEVLNLARGNRRLPRYMREALLDAQTMRAAMTRAFARIQVEGLSTPELKAAYRDLLKALDRIQDGEGQRHLLRKVRVAFEERMRYFAKRIAETELHKAYAHQQARELMADTAVQYVQWRLSPMHPVPDICDYFAKVDRFGLGPGVYPKRLAPVAPAHPFCKCVLSPRLDLNDKEIKPKEDAERAFFNSQSEENQRLIAGSRGKLDRIKRGESAWDVHNSRIDPEYQVRQAGQV